MATTPTPGQTTLLPQDPSFPKRSKMFGVFCILKGHQSIDVSHIDDYREINVKSDFQFFPNWRFLWDENYGYYRAYIYVASKDSSYKKVNAGYSVCTIKSSLVVAAFITAFSFLYKNRAFKVA